MNEINATYNIFKTLKIDFNSNFTYRNPKPFVIIFSFRLTSFFAQNKYKLIKILGYPIRILYRLVIEWILGVEIPDTTKIGSGIVIHHGMGLVLNPDVIIGNNVILRHNTTIGHITDDKGNSLGSPKIENNVNVGANVVIIGDIIIGENSIIGAGSVVVKNIPPNSVVVGNPGKIIRSL